LTRLFDGTFQELEIVGRGAAAQFPTLMFSYRNKDKQFFVLRKEPKDFYSFAAPTIEAMPGIYP
jgi:hypothetical protein